MARGILVPRPGFQPASPALEGGFFTTGPRGKSLSVTFKRILSNCRAFEGEWPIRMGSGNPVAVNT